MVDHVSFSHTAQHLVHIYTSRTAHPYRSVHFAFIVSDPNPVQPRFTSFDPPHTQAL